MATEQEDGSWKSIGGSTHDTKGTAENADFQFQQRMSSIGRSNGPNASEGVAKLFPLLVGIGVVAGIVLFLVMVVKNVLSLMKETWLFPVAIALALAVLIAVRILLKGRKLRTIAALLAAAVVGFLGWNGAAAIYGAGNFHFPSAYSADYITALPDGSAPSLYEKRHQKGNVLAELSVDQRVTVNGVTFNSAEYNITTADGVTGWVEAAAFPTDAQERPFARKDSGGETREPIYKDRLAERLAARYLVEQKGYSGRYQITQKTLDASAVAGVEVPIWYLDGDELRNSKRGETVELADTGDKVELNNIMYADDCTMVFLTAGRAHDFIGWDISGDGNTVEWQTSLTAKDLDSGESWQALPMERRYTYMEVAHEGKYLSAVIYFFPPFKSRHFSLTHNGTAAMPDKDAAGHGGILGFFNKINIFGSSPGSNYIDWNFPEVQVR
jgi:hypothetical protein